MEGFEIEKCFNRALSLCISKKKFFIVFPVLFLCGIFIVYCRAFASDASSWIKMSLAFLPILLSSGILLSLGALLIRIYYHEVKRLKFHYTELLGKSWDLIIGTAYLAIPPVLVYLMVWILLGIFLLLQEIPGIGNAISILLSFWPFLLILSSLLLCLFNLALLFFVTPAVALKSQDKTHLAKEVFASIQNKLFSNILFLLMALLPIGFVVGVLSFAATLTHENYFAQEHPLSIGLYWFFIMIPFSAILTPGVIFFFNFAAESYNYLQKKVQGLS